jgi:hypothetical protein
MLFYQCLRSLGMCGDLRMSFHIRGSWYEGETERTLRTGAIEHQHHTGGHSTTMSEVSKHLFPQCPGHSFDITCNVKILAREDDWSWRGVEEAI